MVNNESLWQGGGGKGYGGLMLVMEQTDRQLYSVLYPEAHPDQHSHPFYITPKNESIKVGPFLYLNSTCPCHYFQRGTDEQGYLDSDPNLR